MTAIPATEPVTLVHLSPVPVSGSGSVPTWLWICAACFLAVIVAVDVIAGRQSTVAMSKTAAACWMCVYIGYAAALALAIGWSTQWSQAGLFISGYLTESSLSADNLIVFMLIMSGFAVPKFREQEVLLFGIVLALILRMSLIAAGSVLIGVFSPVMLVLSIVLGWTAIKVWNQERDGLSELPRPIRHLIDRTSEPDAFASNRLWVHTPEGRRLTAFAAVIAALGITDLLFALDSIPAIFGITQVAAIVIAANVCALMGLRQMYVLLASALARVRYLTRGLAVVLGFIAAKMLLSFIARHVGLSYLDLPSWVSLVIIVSVLTSTWALSLGTHEPKA